MAGDNEEPAGNAEDANVGGQHAPNQVSAYRAPKIPQFWKNDPQAWFVQVEASFRIAQITGDRTKVDHLIAVVDHEVVCHVTDLVTQSPTPPNLYVLFKNRVLSAFSTSTEARVRQLLKGQLLGDLKPSHLLSKMKSLSGGQCNDTV